nr:MAG TPA: hypothetical protein [Caudoviricetes sp.]
MALSHFFIAFSYCLFSLLIRIILITYYIYNFLFISRYSKTYRIICYN